MWICGSCGKKHHDNFDAYWHCGTTDKGVSDPVFSRERDESTGQRAPNSSRAASHRSSPIAFKRSWFRIKLRTLLVAATVVAFGLAWWFGPYTVTEPLPFYPSNHTSNFLDYSHGKSTGLTARHQLRRSWDGSERYYGRPLEFYYSSGQLAASIEVHDRRRLEDVALMRFREFQAEYYFSDGTKADSFEAFLKGKNDETHAKLYRNLMRSIDPRIR